MALFAEPTDERYEARILCIMEEEGATCGGPTTTFKRGIYIIYKYRLSRSCGKLITWLSRTASVRGFESSSGF